MKHGSLFSGIGGFDLAAEWMEWENVFHCEWNEFGQKVLKHYWPNAISYHDITKTDFTIHRGTIDILTGGFPCQPYSTAGKRLGKEDERHLWPEMLRAIREIQPRWVVGENVFGLVNWNGGMVFHEVQADLEAEGYEVQPYVLPACAVNAPHRRDRVWFVAHRINKKQREQAIGRVRAEFGNSIGASSNSTNERLESRKQSTRQSTQTKDGTGLEYRIANDGINGLTANTLRQRHAGKEYWQEVTSINPENDPGFRWANFPTQPPVCSRNDGLPAQLDGITFPKWRNESIKAGGNAVVPQVVLQIFKAIQQFENVTK